MEDPGNVKEKEMQRENFWIPETPVVGRQWKDHPSRSFLAGNSASTTESTSFDDSWYELESAFPVAKQKEENSNGATNLNGVVAECHETLGFEYSKKRGPEDMDDALLADIPFTELLNLPNTAPSFSPVSAPVEKVTSNFISLLNSQIESSFRRLNTRNRQEIQMQKYDCRNQEKDEEKDAGLFPGSHDGKLHESEPAEANGGAASSAVSTPSRKHNRKKRDISGIDLNKRPWQRTKKKKHRPKVVVEGLPKRTPKPKTPKPVTPKHAVSEKDTLAKRKYVRKNIIKQPPSQEAAENSDSAVCVTSKKSCKRALNFDIVRTVAYECGLQDNIVRKLSSEELLEENAAGRACLLDHLKKGYHLSRVEREAPIQPYTENQHQCNVLNQNRSDMIVSQALIFQSEVDLATNPNDPGNNSHGYKYKNLQVYKRRYKGNHCLNQSRKLAPNFPKIFKQKRSIRRRKATMSNVLWSVVTEEHSRGQATTCSGYKTNSSHRLRNRKRSLAPKFTPMEVCSKFSNSGITYHSPTTKSTIRKQRSFKKITSRAKAATLPSLKKQSFKSMLSLCHSKVIIKKKRSHRFIRKRNLASLTAIPTCNWLLPNPPKRGPIGERRECMDALKEHKTGNRVKVGQIEDGSSLMDAKSNNQKSEEWPVQQEDFLPFAPINQALHGERQVSEIFCTPKACKDVFGEGQGFEALNKLEVGINTIAPGKSKKMVATKQINTVNQMHTGHKSGLEIVNVPEPCMDLIVSSKRNKRVARKQTKMGPSLGSYNRKSKARPPEHEDIWFNGNLTDPEVIPQLIESIIQKLKGLQLSNIDNNSGALVPYLKKGKSSGKVILDTETMRAWKLLMAKEDQEGADKAADEDKKKWWEEERNVFKGRVDSFIARMHLIQGDRRFSPWKGSITDSVVGVFLTQNVSDHLSSSAFMSLAAKFPIQPTSTVTACSEDWNFPNSQESIGSISLVEFSSGKTSSTKKIHSARTSESGTFEELPQYKHTALPQDLYSNESKKSSGDESSEGRWTEPNELEYAKQNTNLERLDGLSCTYLPVHSSDANNCSYEIPVTPCNPELESIELLDKFVPKKTKNLDHMDTIKKFEWMEDMESEITSQQREPTKEALSFSTCHTSPESSSHTESFTHTYNVRQGGRTMNQQPEKLPFDEHKTLHHCNSIPRQASDAGSTKKRNQTEDVINQALPDMAVKKKKPASGRRITGTVRKNKATTADWDRLRRLYSRGQRQRSSDTMDSVDWEAVKCAPLDEVAKTIKVRGQQFQIGRRIQDFLDRVAMQHKSLDLEWLRDAPPDDVKEFLLSINGLGLKSVECVRLLALQHIAFPVDTNVGRIAVRLGWVPLQPLPEELQIHLLDLYPMMDSIQKYLWPRLCTLDQLTLYELHYQMITFGKVFCTKRNPNCNVCPLRGECRHFASAFASAKLALPGPEEKCVVTSTLPVSAVTDRNLGFTATPLSFLEDNPHSESGQGTRNYGPIIEEPASPEPECTNIAERDIEDFCDEDSDDIQTIKLNLECTNTAERDIEDFYDESSEEIPTINLNLKKFTNSLQDYVLQEGDMSKALVALTSEAASIPRPKLKFESRLRTQHHVYELPDSHPLLMGLEGRETDDPCPYLLSIWLPGETANSMRPSKKGCNTQESGNCCNEETCFSCNSIREQNSQTIRGTILIPCRTAMRGRFPLNGTYFQVNEVFADDESSHNPIQVPTEWIWKLPRRILYCGTSATSIFRGLSTEEIQFCFWRGYICVRGFDRKTGAPRPLVKRLYETMAERKKPEKDDV